MPKVALLSLPRLVRKCETRTFTDPEQPGVAVTLTLRRLNALEGSLAAERAAELVSLYGETGYPLLNGEAATITTGIAQSLCALEQMQLPEDPSRYSAEELIGLVVNMPTAWGEIALWAAALNAPPRVPAPNADAEDADEDDAGNAPRAA